MAVLIQVVQGERWGRYYMPFGAGVAFSRNLYRWAPKIRREVGFSRLVWGLGTRAVERVGNDYPRMVALSHPTLHPDDSPEAVRRYSQQFVDVIDLEDNLLTTLPVRDVLDARYPSLRLLVQLADEGFLRTPVSSIMASDIPKLTVTFDGFLRRTPFAGLLSAMLRTLEDNYHVPVDVEFTLRVEEGKGAQPQLRLSLLQCRPQSQLQSGRLASLPDELPPDRLAFSTRFMVPQGYVPIIRHVLFVEPLGNDQSGSRGLRELRRHLQRRGPSRTVGERRRAGSRSLAWDPFLPGPHGGEHLPSGNSTRRCCQRFQPVVLL